MVGVRGGEQTGENGLLGWRSNNVTGDTRGRHRGCFLAAVAVTKSFQSLIT